MDTARMYTPALVSTSGSIRLAELCIQRQIIDNMSRCPLVLKAKSTGIFTKGIIYLPEANIYVLYSIYHMS